MALIYLVKRALGFDNTADETDDDIDNPFISINKTGAIAAESRVLPPESKSAEVTDEYMPLVDASLPGCIFDSVIRLFNRTLPDFVRECLDTDSQRQYLFHAIESDVRRQLIRVMDEVRLNAAKSAATKEPASDMQQTDNLKRQLRTAYTNFRRENEALERRIIELETSLQEANDENARLQNEINTLNRRIRRSKSKPAIDDDAQPSLF